MRVVILSRSRALYTTRRLVQACRQAGHQAVVLDPFDLFLAVGNGEARLFLRDAGRSPGSIDLAFPRIGSALTDHGLVVIQQMEVMGIPLVNRTAAIAMARDKMSCLQRLAQQGIAVPRTVMIRHPQQLSTALDEVGGPPVVLKLLQGSQGIGVILLETRDAVESVLDTLWSLGQVILIQEFVAESRGRDVRALVVGGRVLAAMRREAKAGEFRSNLHRGGSGTVIELAPEYRQAALESARVAGLDIAGVDMLEARDGPKVMEVNASPGFQGLEIATGIDIAAEMVHFGLTLHAAEKRAS